MLSLFSAAATGSFLLLPPGDGGDLVLLLVLRKQILHSPQSQSSAWNTVWPGSGGGRKGPFLVGAHSEVYKWRILHG